MNDMHEAQKRSFMRVEAGFGSDAEEAAYRKALRETLDNKADVRDEILDTDKLNIVLANICDSIKYLQCALAASYAERTYYMWRSSEARKNAEKEITNE